VILAGVKASQVSEFADHVLEPVATRDASTALRAPISSIVVAFTRQREPARRFS